MSENVITLSELFALRAEPSPGPGPEQDWRDQLGARLDEELKGVKWPTALPDLAKKLGELLDLPLPTFFLDAWKQLEELQVALKETSGKTNESRSVKIGQHSIESTFEPSIQVRLWKVMPLPKELKFPVKLEATFRALELQIKNGAIARIIGGECDIAGTLSLGSTPIAKKKFGSIRLDGALFEAEVPLGAMP